MKYVKVMDGLKSNAGGFSYKLDEVNIAEKWDVSVSNPEQMGGFNFGTEDKILRWIHRGDTIYDVIIPEDTEVILCDEEKGIYRSNKIIVTNPRVITDEIILDLYKKTTLTDKIISQCLMVLLWKDKLEISKFIIKDRVNTNNINEIINEFENYASNGDFVYDKLGEKSKIIYDILKEIQSNLSISLYVDKEPYTKILSEDKIINLTGESGSGKSYFSNKWKDDNNYIIIDTDIVFSDKPSENIESVEVRKLFIDKPKDYLINNFDECYKAIINYFKDTNKIIVIDSAQYRNIKDISLLKGKIIIMRTSINKCYERCIERWKNRNKGYSVEELEQFKNKKLGMFKWYKNLNKFINRIDNMK